MIEANEAPDEDPWANAYIEGHKAARWRYPSAQTEEACPYPELSMEAYWWTKGFRDCRAWLAERSN